MHINLNLQNTTKRKSISSFGATQVDGSLTTAVIAKAEWKIVDAVSGFDDLDSRWEDSVWPKKEPHR